MDKKVKTNVDKKTNIRQILIVQPGVIIDYSTGESKLTK